jgi:trehalose/maltose hydrolase-like predicted phosphorylase
MEARAGGRPTLHVSRLRAPFGWLHTALSSWRRAEAPAAGNADPRWTLSVGGEEPELRRVHESVLALSDTQFGTRGTPEEDGHGTEPLVAASAVYMPGAGEHAEATPGLLPGPRWTVLGEGGPGISGVTQTLDLRSGVLEREIAGPRMVRTVRFASLARPGVMVLRAEAPEGTLTAGDELAPPVEGVRFERSEHGRVTYARTSASSAWIAAAARSAASNTEGRTVMDRTACYEAGYGEPVDVDSVVQRLEQADRLGFDGLLAEHEDAWAARWRTAAIVIDGDPEAEIGVRLALFHLMAAVADRGEAGVGARGLTGHAYRGHVFWDADVFVLPFLAATHPPAARAMLAYRSARLGAARRAAAARGLAGARFPWESAADGTDVTPRTVLGLGDAVLPILTGEHQEHITADVAWAVDHYLAWSADTDFASGPAHTLLIDTARYWASRIRVDADGDAHIDGVMGPDEYHAPVDDNAFTNLMVRHNLLCAADRVTARAPVGLREEADRWRHLADRLVDGYDPDRRRHEQFAGFDDLEPLMITDLVDVPIAADVLLGHERVAATQVIKQADVLMAHHLLPGALPGGSLAADLDHYLPRTAHGSSLSPAIHASLLARAAQPDRGLDLFRIAARLDLDDLTGTTAGGIHLATAGSLWQALAYGYLGLRPGPVPLTLDPCLPSAWEALEINIQLRGTPVSIRAEHDRLTVRPTHRVPVLLDGRIRPAGPDRTTFRRVAGRWQEMTR